MQPSKTPSVGGSTLTVPHSSWKHFKTLHALNAVSGFATQFVFKMLVTVAVMSFHLPSTSKLKYYSVFLKPCEFGLRNNYGTTVADSPTVELRQSTRQWTECNSRTGNNYKHKARSKQFRHNDC